MIKFQSRVEYHCDDLEVVHKLNTLDNNPNHYNEQYKTTDHDVVLTLRDCLPPNVKTFHVKGHQDQRKQPQHLIHIKTDHLIGSNAKVLMEKHILNNPMVICI